MSTKTLARSFAGGEISPEMFGRVDLTQYQTGVAEAINFMILPHGPARARKGTQFVNNAKINGKKCALVEFSFNNQQAYALEFGDLYVRFHTLGGTLSVASVPVELVTPYTEADVGDLHYVQSADVLTIVHPNYPPKELKRTSSTTFTLTDISFVPTIAAPSGVTITPTGTGTTSFSYVVTAVATESLEETGQSNTVTATNTLTTAGNFNTINWAAITGATRYYIYKLRNGLFGFIGETDGVTFRDDNITPDMTRTPPQTVNPFSGAGNYPGAVTYFEQRRCFAGTNNKPQNFWTTRAGTEANMNYSIPTRDDDAIILRLTARQVSKIEHMIPLSDLLLLTTDGDFRIYTQNSDIFSPNTVSARAQSYYGASNVQPITTGESAVYVRNQSSRVHEVAYDNVSYAFRSNDISIMAPHLFDTYTITDMALTRTPFPIVWVVRNDGVLLGVTYMPSQKVWGWHQHTTDGFIESICGIPEGTKDVLYMSVQRTVNGVTKRFIERLDLQEETVLADAFHVDCGLTYSGAATTAITGLGHLEGKTVNILADGAVHPQKVVTAGAITLDFAASKVTVGLPLTAYLTTLPLTLQSEAFAQGQVKNVNRVYLRVYRAGEVYVGPNKTRLTKYQDRTDSEYGSVPALQSAELNIEVLPSWGPYGQLTVRNSDPTPMTVLSMVLDVALGG